MKSSFCATILIMLFTQNLLAQTAKDLLTEDIMKSKKVMSSDVNLYNYFYLPGSEDLSWMPDEAYRTNWVLNYYIKPRAGTFWSPEFTDSNAKNYANGAGLYFAIDPVISKQYGDTFIQITIPKGTAFINVVKPISIRESTKQALEKEGYLTKSEQIQVFSGFPKFPKSFGFYRDTLRLMVEPRFIKFRNLVQDIFHETGIQFIEYNFRTELGQICSAHSYSAFTLIGSKDINDNKLAVLPENLLGTTIQSTIRNIPNVSEAESLVKIKVLKLRDMIESMLTNKLGSKSRAKLAAETYPALELKELKKSLYSCETK